MSTFLVFLAPVKVSAFCAAEDRTVFIGIRDQLLIVSPNNTVKQLRCPIDSPCKIEVSGENTVTIYDYTYFREYDLSSGKIGDTIDLQHIQQKQNLREPIYAGDAEYYYIKRFGRYSIWETKPDGETILRYEMPSLDYVFKMCAIISSVLVFASIPFVLVHIFRNYKVTDRGRILWNERKR